MIMFIKHLPIIFFLAAFILNRKLHQIMKSTSHKEFAAVLEFYIFYNENI